MCLHLTACAHSCRPSLFYFQLHGAALWPFYSLCLSPLSAEGSAAELTSAAPAADGSLIVTVAASLPRGSSTAAEEAQYMASVLRNDAKQARFCC